jgi:hypothetical protein
MTRGHDTDLRTALVAHLLGLATGAAMIVGLTPAALALVRSCI